ncbi:MAG: phospholipase domain-containing protein, partial [Jatrophihabitantaceae bacterium]
VAGNAATTSAGIEATLTITGARAHPTLLLTVANTSRKASAIRYTGLDGTSHALAIPARGTATASLDALATDQGWYDLSITLGGQPCFVRRFAGHLENGQPSITG